MYWKDLAHRNINNHLKHIMPINCDFTQTHQISQSFPNAAIQLSNIILTYQFTEKLQNHGCWCSRLAGADYSGGRVLDTLDGICKEWAQMRRCLNIRGGSCECDGIMDGIVEKSVSTSNYSVITSDTSFCPFIKEIEIDCLDLPGEADTENIDKKCPKDKCLIDTKFINEIDTFFKAYSLDAGNFNPVIANKIICQVNHTNSKNKITSSDIFCYGNSPNLEIIQEVENGRFKNALKLKTTKSKTTSRSIKITSKYPNSANQLLNLLFRHDFAEKIQNHGCWCSRLAYADYSGGKPIDHLDSLCKNWAQSRRCLKLRGIGGSCYHQESSNYEIMKELHADESCVLSKDMNKKERTTKVHFSCLNGSNPLPCQQDQCLVDLKYLTEIKNHIKENAEIYKYWSVTVGNETICKGENSENDRTNFELKCDGKAPDLFILRELK